MPTIPLDRRFIEWRNTENELSDPDLLGRMGLSSGAKNWDELLRRRRVVILAEAGSGKSEELKERARCLEAEGKFSFYATVQDVGKDGVAGALGETQRTALDRWRASDQPAWFFIDSIDEAKLDGMKLERAFRNIAEGICGAEGRAHIVLSGRHTDWEFRRDLARLRDLLPLAPEHAAPPSPKPDELLIHVLHHETPPEEKPPEEPLIAVLASLDAERVRKFAAGKGAGNLDSLLAEIDRSNLWRFARRPIDLDWLVDFWIANNRLGSLAEMLATSLKERLVERDPARSRRDPIDPERAMQALERIGAALVLGRKVTIAIPDDDFELSGDATSFELRQILPDWSGTDRARMLTRAVFDPATFGCVRLHNDNEAVVRAYLAARWLHRLRQTNLSREGLFFLLFSDTYGLQIVKPSLQETAAWLAISDPDVAREVIHREPYLLLTGGDPASLPPDIRAAALTRLMERIVANDEHLPMLDYDSVKRFSRPDLAPAIRQLWPVHKGHREARDLMLRLIWLGELRECADLAEDALMAAMAASGDRHDQMVAGRALMATADEASRRRYARRVVETITTLPPAVVWDAVEWLFPSILGVEDLLTILARIDVTDRDGGVGFQWQAPDLIKRLTLAADLERLLVGLQALLGPDPRDIRAEAGDREEAFMTATGAAAYQLLNRFPDDRASVAAIDAAIRIGRHVRYSHRTMWEKVGNLRGELQKSASRRRLAFWRAAEQMHGHPFLQGRLIEHPWEMEILGWNAGLTVEDVDWLLADAPRRTDEHERKLAINAALQLWAGAGRSEACRSQIEAAASGDAAMQSAVTAWMHPPPRDPGLMAQERELRRIQQRNAADRAAADQSWREFVERLRNDPDQLRHLNHATEDTVDSRLYHLWSLLASATRGSSRYAIDSIAPVEPILGPELAAALRDGLIRHWRSWNPRAKSLKSPEERNSMNSIDAMGIVGVTMEARNRGDWADHLDPDLARRATVYATLELNGFPTWMQDVARRWPAEVSEILSREIAAELDMPDSRYGVLYDIGRSDDTTLAAMVPYLLNQLERREDLPVPILSQLLNTLERAPAAAERLSSLAMSRVLAVDDLAVASLYVGTAFTVDPTAATEVLIRKFDQLRPQDQTRLVQGLLPSLFGDGFSRDRPVARLSFENLERIVRLAYQTIRVEDDNDRPSGVVFSPDARDHAERARNGAFKALHKTLGRATFNALLRFAEIPDFPISPRRLRHLARERASYDSEAGPWPPGETRAFEDQCQALPHRPLDLQRLMLAKLADMQHSLLNDDFAQGTTLSGLGDERAVQNWMADRLRTGQGRSYTLEREPHVVGEKEPDIRIRSANDASVPLEIKVAESWTLKQLEAALIRQLCGRYLRAKQGRHGILLLVHQKPRSRGWQHPTDGRRLDFAEVAEHLRGMAKAISGKDPDAPQPEIAVIDVSTCVVTKKGKKKAKTTKAKTKNRAPAAKARPRKRKALSSSKRMRRATRTRKRRTHHRRRV